MNKMNKEPLISILMNCFNGERYLEHAINSVLIQSYKNWELIFWDNQSNDNSVKIISNFKDKRIRIYKSNHHTNLGQARKNAFEKVKGEYLAFLDVDDLWEKDKLNNQIKIFDDKEVGISFSNSLFFSAKKKKKLYKSNLNFDINTKSLITKYILSLESIMLDVKKVKNLDYDFDYRFSHISDFDLIVRLSSISKVKYLNQVLSGWRIHDNNESFKRKELFNKEIVQWCDYHLENNYLQDYIQNIQELKFLTEAKNRILCYEFKLSTFKSVIFNKMSNGKNKLFIFISFIPFFPKLFYIIDKFLFKIKWY